MKKYFISFIFIAFFSFGCSQKVVTQPETIPQQQQQKEQKKAETSQPVKPPERITEPVIASNIESAAKKDDSESLAGKEDLFKDILFDFDKYEVREEFQPVVKAVAAWMLKNPAAALSVEGHCDDRGTNEYNLALGDRRAKAVRDYLVSLGVPSSRIETLSYGEEKPSCTDQTEECWTRNRRAHFVVLTKAGK